MARDSTRHTITTHTVGPETPKAPAGWEDRLIPIVLPAMNPKHEQVRAWCMEIHDLVLAKLAAGRPHDFEFVDEAIRAGLVDHEQLQLGVDLVPPSHRELTRQRLAGALARVS